GSDVCSSDLQAGDHPIGTVKRTADGLGICVTARQDGGQVVVKARTSEKKIRTFVNPHLATHAPGLINEVATRRQVDFGKGLAGNSAVIAPSEGGQAGDCFKQAFSIDMILCELCSLQVSRVH